jgi:putative ABC transport system permease protein
MRQKKDAPPLLGEKILKIFLPKGESLSVAGDYEELYTEIVQSRGKFMAFTWYWTQIVKSIWAGFTVYVWWSLTMFKSYLMIALRNIRKNKAYSLITIIGLATGIAVCILIFLFVEYELGFDSHVEGKENIYRVVTHRESAEGESYSGGTPFPTAASLRSDFAEMELTTQMYKDSEMMITVGENRYKGDIVFFVESQFFKLFDPEWIQGSASHALDDPFVVVLTERLADKYFGNTKVIGKILQLNNKYDLRVTGIISNSPRRASLPYDLLISWKTLNALWGGKRLDQWDLLDAASHTFTRLSESVETKRLEKRFEQFERKYMEPEYAKSWSFRLQALEDIHFNPRYGSYNYITSRTALFAFSGIGLLILVIACINFVNLTTAQAMKRGQEIGMRKVLGASRVQLIRQLLGETSLITLISILVALFLAERVLPYLNQFLGNHTELRIFSSSSVFIFLGIIFLLMSCLNGLYPALVLTQYQPVEAFKGPLSYRGKGSLVFRNSLVLIQFIVSQILIVGTLVIAGQMKFMSNRNLGFRSKEILTIQIPAYEEARCEALRSRWMQNPSIQEVSFAWSAPTSRSDFKTPFEYETSGNIIEFPVAIKMCDKRYLDIYQIPLAAGRFFARNVNDESDIQWVISASVVHRMGLSNSQEAIGKQITVNDMKGQVIGVTDDFHGHSLHSEIQPVVFFNFWPSNFREAQILLDMNNVRGTINHIREAWTEFYPEYIFQYEFLADYIKSLYETESKLMIMIQSASVLSILIACLGLLGLVSFMVLQRSKEIGIRKVLGATMTSVYFMISKEFLKWIVIANIVAWPVAYYLTNEWLMEFAYRIPLNAANFIIGGFLSFGIAALVMSYQVMRAASANPVETLRYE